MFYVYAKNVKTGKEEMVNSMYNTAKDAIEKIYANYKIDKDLRQLGDTSIFIKKGKVAK